MIATAFELGSTFRGFYILIILEPPWGFGISCRDIRIFGG